MLLPALQKIQGSCVIDGELCALDAHGRSHFQLLQNALNKKARLLYVIFDTLFVDGKDTREKPLLERKEILEHFPLMLIHSLRVGRNWRILADKRREGANEFCARGPVSFAQPPFAAVL